MMVWEYGSGMGHVSLIMPLALQLNSAGYEVVMYLRAAEATKALWAHHTDIKVKQAPYIRLKEPEHPGQFISYTLIDALRVGEAIDENKLHGLADLWEKILLEEKPDLVIGEFAMTFASITIGRIPTLTIGTGYSIPPSGGPFPAVRFWNQEVPESTKADEARWVEITNQVRQKRSLAPFMYSTDAFKGDGSFVCTYPELDSYSYCRKDPVYGPFKGTILDKEHVLANEKYDGFFYLAFTPNMTPSILDGLVKSGLRMEGYIRQLPEEIRLRYANHRSVYLHTAPQPLEKALRKRTILIHHGGIGTSEIALRAGIAQYVLPRHLEQKINGSLLKKIGVADFVMENEAVKSGTKWLKPLQRLVSDRAVKQRALARSVSIKGRDKDAASRVVMARVKELIG